MTGNLRNVCLVVGCLAWLGGEAVAATIRVPGDVATIQAAIDQSANGDLILVAAGTYTVTSPIDFRGRAITVRGEDGAASTILRFGQADIEGRASLVRFDGAEPREAVLEGFTLTEGRGLLVPVGNGRFNMRMGGAMFIGPLAEPTVVRCVFRSNTAHRGSAVFVDVDSHPTFEDCHFIDNSPDFSAFENSVAGFVVGGAILGLEDSEILVVRGSFESNSSVTGGAVFAEQGSFFRFEGTQFLDNNARMQGGAVAAQFSRLELVGCRFVRNSAMFSDDNSVFFSSAGAVHWRSFDISANLLVDDCDFEENVATGGGGAMIIDSGNFRLVDETLATVTGSRFVRNRSAGHGGAITVQYESRGVEISGSSFLGNYAEARGGGIYVVYDSFYSISDSVFVGNAADSGGAIYDDGASRGFLDHITVARNSAAEGGGVYFDERSTAVSNSVLWGNAGGNLVVRNWPLIDVRPVAPVSVVFSCVTGPELWPGEGNINTNPQLAGWADRQEEVFVDSNAAPGGDGSAERPFADARDALTGFEPALSLLGSPCIGTAAGGANMGADIEPLPQTGSLRRILRFASGRYELRGQGMALVAEISGSGAEATTFDRGVLGLQGELSDVSIENAVVHGAVVVGVGDAASVSNCEIRKSHRAIRCNDLSDVVIDHCRVTNCSGANDFGGGGGLRLGPLSKVSVDSSLFAGITDGVVRIRWADLSVTNSVFVGNQGTQNSFDPPSIIVVDPRFTPANGGLEGTTSTVSFTHCTFSQNIAGLLIFTQQPNTMFVDNSLSFLNGSDDFSGQVRGSMTGVDPLFERLGEYDFGFTSRVEFDDGRHFLVPDAIRALGSYRLRSESPAFDAGLEAFGVASDFDGRSRPCGDGFDVGAYEAGGCEPASFVRGDWDGSGSINVTDAIGILGFLFLGSDGPSCLSMADVDDNDTVELTDPIALLNFSFLGGDAPAPPFESCGIDPTPEALSCWYFDACAQ